MRIKCGKHYVKAPNEGVMSIILTDMSFKYHDEELISKIKRQKQHDK